MKFNEPENFQACDTQWSITRKYLLRKDIL